MEDRQPSLVEAVITWTYSQFSVSDGLELNSTFSGFRVSPAAVAGLGTALIF
jgi:hypothetical protein